CFRVMEESRYRSSAITCHCSLFTIHCSLFTISVMSSERWQQVKDIFERVIKVAPQAREQYLTDICKGDETLLNDVKSLIAAQSNKLTVSDAYENRQTLSLGEQAEAFENTQTLSLNEQAALGVAKVRNL